MNANIIAILAITGERLLVVSSGLTAIVLGWKLFSQILPKQSGTIEFGNWKVELKAVGPGIFFSLFGSLVLAHALSHPATYKVYDNEGHQNVAIGVDEAAKEPDSQTIRAINTVIQIDEDLSGAKDQSSQGQHELLAVQANDLHSSATILRDYRRELLLARFNAAQFDEWEQNKEKYLKTPTALSGELRARLAKIAPWMTQTVADIGLIK